MHHSYKKMSMLTIELNKNQIVRQRAGKTYVSFCVNTDDNTVSCLMTKESDNLCVIIFDSENDYYVHEINQSIWPEFTNVQQKFIINEALDLLLDQKVEDQKMLDELDEDE